MTNTFIKKNFFTTFSSPGITSTLVFDFSNGGPGGTSALNSALYITCFVVFSDTNSQVGVQSFDLAFRCASGTATQISSTFSIIPLLGSGTDLSNQSYSFFASGSQIFFQADYSASSPSATFHDFSIEGFLLT